MCGSHGHWPYTVVLASECWTDGSRMVAIVRHVRDRQDCESVVALTAAAFPEEVRGSGLTRYWSELELEDLIKQSWCWTNIGETVVIWFGRPEVDRSWLSTARGMSANLDLPEGDIVASLSLYTGVACREDDGRIVGAIVLAFPGDPDTGITYTDVRHKVGCCGTMWNWAYDQILEKPLKAHECLIEFIAVSSSERGHGIGAKLLVWAENLAAQRSCSRKEKQVVSGTSMTLWVAADNTPALALYTRQGYAPVARTDCGLFSWFYARLLNSFLGHPVWVRMTKRILPSPRPHVECHAIPPTLLLATLDWTTAQDEQPEPSDKTIP